MMSFSMPAFAQNKSQKSLLMSLTLAKKIAQVAITHAKKLKAPGGAIAIVDASGYLVHLVRLDHTFPASSTISIGKARTAALFRKETLVFEQAITNKGRTAMVSAIHGFTPMQGGILIKSKGKIIGAIGVSGAASAPQDEEIAIAAAKTIY